MACTLNEDFVVLDDSLDVDGGSLAHGGESIDVVLERADGRLQRTDVRLELLNVDVHGAGTAADGCDGELYACDALFEVRDGSLEGRDVLGNCGNIRLAFVKVDNLLCTHNSGTFGGGLADGNGVCQDLRPVCFQIRLGEGEEDAVAVVRADGNAVEHRFEIL